MQAKLLQCSNSRTMSRGEQIGQGPGPRWGEALQQPNEALRDGTRPSAPDSLNITRDAAQIARQVERLHALDDPQFARELGVLLGPPFVNGNSAEILLNGDQIFPPMLKAIDDAQHSITFETCIYWSGAIGQQFARALTGAARRGVKCHVLLDWLGSARMDPTMIDQMAAAGVQIRRFHPPHWSHLARMNNRTHRKLLVVDSRVGFTGGVGIAPPWTGHAQDAEHRRAVEPAGGVATVTCACARAVPCGPSTPLSRCFAAPSPARRGPAPRPWPRPNRRASTGPARQRCWARPGGGHRRWRCSGR